MIWVYELVDGPYPKTRADNSLPHTAGKESADCLMRQIQIDTLDYIESMVVYMTMDVVFCITK